MAKQKRKPGALYFTDVARAGRGAVILVGNYYALEDASEERIALLSLKNRTWGGMDLSGIAHAIRLSGRAGDPKRQYLILERNRGLYRVTPPKSVKFSTINEERDGFLMDMRKIGRNWYAVGGHHQVYREINGKWKTIDSGVYVPGESGEAKILLSIDGTAEDDIYATGFNGVIFHFDGNAWTNLDSPTNLGLQRVLCLGKKEVYICGHGNSLFRGNSTGWVPLTEPDESTTYWDMASFKGDTYVCTKTELYIIKDNQLELVNIPVDGPVSFYRMDSDSHELWTCGDECLLKFDGRNWEQFIFPDNE